MARFYAFAFGVSRLAAVAAAGAMVFMVGIIALEIILRALFSTSTFVTAEFVGYAMMLCVVWSLGYVLESGQLIRVQLLLTHLPPRARNLLTAGAAFAVGLGTVGLALVFWTRAARAYQRGTVSSSIAAVPTWIPETIMLIGLLVFAIQLFALGLRHVTGHPSPAAPVEETLMD